MRSVRDETIESLRAPTERVNDVLRELDPVGLKSPYRDEYYGEARRIVEQMTWNHVKQLPKIVKIVFEHMFQKDVLSDEVVKKLSRRIEPLLRNVVLR